MRITRRARSGCYKSRTPEPSVNSLAGEKEIWRAAAADRSTGDPLSWWAVWPSGVPLPQDLRVLISPPTPLFSPAVLRQEWSPEILTQVRELSSVGSRQPASRPDLRHCLESTQNLGGGGGRKGPGFISFVIVAKPPSVKSLSHVGVIYLSVNTGVMLCLSGWFSKLIARTCFKHVVKRAGGSGWA